MTHPDKTLEQELREKLDEVSARLYARDLTVIDLFWKSGQFWLLGSANEEDMTRDALRAHLENTWSNTSRFRFVFDEVHAQAHADMAWLHAPAVLEVHHPDRVTRRPYRLFALFQRIEGDWCWRVFSGSEPAPQA
jgi:hypothetical protein